MHRLLLVLFFLPLCVFARKEGRDYVDSLEHALQSANSDTLKISLLSRLSNEYRTIDPDIGMRYGVQALHLATVTDWKRGKALSRASIGINYQYKSEYPRALENDFAALRIFEERFRVTPKATDKDRHFTEVRAAITRFLDDRFNNQDQP